ACLVFPSTSSERARPRRACGGRRMHRSTAGVPAVSWAGSRGPWTTRSVTDGAPPYNRRFAMDQETLSDHLRRATRNFTSRLPEERVFTLGQALAAELVR